MQPSRIKLEEFNNCPGKARIKRYLIDSGIAPYIQICNVKIRNLFNDRDTLVIAVLPGAAETHVAVSLGKLAVYFAADDFSWEVFNGQYVIRIWWD